MVTSDPFLRVTRHSITFYHFPSISVQIPPHQQILLILSASSLEAIYPVNFTQSLKHSPRLQQTLPLPPLSQQASALQSHKYVNSMSSRIVQGEDEENDVQFAQGEDIEYETEEVYDYYEEIDGADEIVFYDEDQHDSTQPASLLISEQTPSATTSNPTDVERSVQPISRSGIGTKLHKQMNEQYKSIVTPNSQITRPHVLEIGATQRNLKATAINSTKNARCVKETILQLNTDLMTLASQMKSTQLTNSWLDSLILEPQPTSTQQKPQSTQ